MKVRFLTAVLFLITAINTFAQTTKESSYQPTVGVSAWYVDPTWKDLSYRQMGIKVKGEHIIAYEDPFTKKYVDCDIPYRKMTAQEKSQMNYIDSQGRSYELYVGDSQYIAQVGKLTVYFAGYDQGKQKVYTSDEVSEDAYISQVVYPKKVSSLEKFVLSKINSYTYNKPNNPNPLGEMAISFIVNTDGVISDVQILTSPDESLNNSIIHAIKSSVVPNLKDGNHIVGDNSLKVHPASKNGANVACRYEFTLKVRPRISNAQFVQYWDNYFSKKKEDIEFAQKNKNPRKSELSSKVPSELSELNNFIETFPLANINKVTDLNEDKQTSKQWKKIIKDLFKSDNYYKKATTTKNIGIIIKTKDDALILKDYRLRFYASDLLNRLNRKIYYSVLENAASEKFGKDNYYIPLSTYDLTKCYSKEQASQEFKELFERTFNENIYSLCRDKLFKVNYDKWVESYYLSELGKLRNVILNKDKTKIIGEFEFIDSWKLYPSGNSGERLILFDNELPYMLYPLQILNGDKSKWSNGITISTKGR